MSLVNILLFSRIKPRLNHIQDWKDDEASMDSDLQSSTSDSEEESKGAESGGGSDAEHEIEGDFEWVISNLCFRNGILNVCSSLVKKIRLRDGSTSNNTGLLTKDWDFDIEKREAEFKDDLRAASGIGHKRRKVSIVALS